MDEEVEEKYTHDPKKDKQQDDETAGFEDKEEESDDPKQFKAHRKIMFLMGKTIKYTMWAAMAIFAYHFALLKKMKKPEEAPLVSEPFLEAAKFLNWTIHDFTNLMTKPQMTKMLPDRPNMPGM